MKTIPPVRRQAGADLVRVLACYSVISVHFFLYTGFYNEPLNTVGKCLFLLIRNASMICVPLFIMLTGYLMNQKKPSVSYYVKGIKTVSTYLLCSLVCILYKLLTGFEYDVLKSFLKIFTFNAAPYGWYMEMYFGLYLLLPLLNLGFRNMPSEKWKAVTVISLFCMTALPSLLNVYNITDPFWANTPSVSNVYQQFIPQWWRGIYPVTYYLTGAYFSQHPVKIKPWFLLGGFVGVLLAFTGYNEWRSRGTVFVWGIWNDWGSAFIAVLSLCVFLLLIQVKGESFPVYVSKPLAFVSDRCLSVYLLSFIFDERMYYKYLNLTVTDVTLRLPHYFYCVPVIFICSLLAAVIVDCIYFGIELAGRLLFKKLKACQ